MGDEFYFERLQCKKCQEDLGDDIPLWLSTKNDITLTCPSCGTKTRFWLKIKFNSKIVK